MIRRNEGLSHANAKGEAAFPPRGKNNRYRTRRSSSASDLTKCSRSRKARAWLFSQFVFSSDGCAIVADISRSKGDETVPAPVKIEDCKLDLAGHTFVDGSGREVRLTRAETALLTAFVDSPRRVLSRDQLRYAVAGRSAKPYDRSVDMLVARLRRKIEPDPKAPRFILSVQGVGYKFDVRPQSAANELRTLNTPTAIGYSVRRGNLPRKD